VGIFLSFHLYSYPPFIGKNDEEIVAKVKKGIYEFDDEEEWGTVSNEAKELIKKLLVFDPAKRLAANQAFLDPWIVKNTKDHEIEDDQLKRVF
jgi:calcium-dependent protein kinase